MKLQSGSVSMYLRELKSEAHDIHTKRPADKERASGESWKASSSLSQWPEGIAGPMHGCEAGDEFNERRTRDPAVPVGAVEAADPAVSMAAELAVWMAAGAA